MHNCGGLLYLLNAQVAEGVASYPYDSTKEAGQIVWSISPQGRNLSHILCVSCEMLQKKSTFIFIFIFFSCSDIKQKTTLHRIVLFFGVVFSIKGHWLTRLIAHKLKFIFSKKTTKLKKNLPLRFDHLLSKNQTPNLGGRLHQIFWPS